MISMKKLYLSLLMLFMMLPVVVMADGISISCPDSAKVGDTINCTVAATSEQEIHSVDIPYTLPNGLSVSSFEAATINGNPWQGDSSNGSIQLYRDDTVKNTFNLGVLHIKINDGASIGNNTISLNGGKLFYGKNDELGPYSSSDVVAVTSGTTPSNPTPTPANPTPTPGDNPGVTYGGLKSLTSTKGILAPMFRTEQYGYVLTLAHDVESFDLIAVANDSNEVITYTDVDTGQAIVDTSNISFVTEDKESMSIEIKVGNETETYKVIVNREKDSTIGKPELASLTVGGKVVNLISGKYDYEVYLDDVSSYQVQATLADSVNYEFNDDYLTIPFNGTGENEYAILISPKVSGAGSNTYRLVVKKTGGTAPSTTKPTTKTPSNPVTGGVMASVMIIIMIAAFGVSYYLYKQTLNQNN